MHRSFFLLLPLLTLTNTNGINSAIDTALVVVDGKTGCHGILPCVNTDSGKILALDVGIALDNGLTHVMYPRGEPMRGQRAVLLTTPRKGQTMIDLILKVGQRAAHNSLTKVFAVRHQVTWQQRTSQSEDVVFAGCAQVLFQMRLRQSTLLVTATTMHDGSARIDHSWCDDTNDPTIILKEEDNKTDAPQRLRSRWMFRDGLLTALEGGRTNRADTLVGEQTHLPSLWRLEAALVSQKTHPGYTIANRFIKLCQREFRIDTCSDVGGGCVTQAPPVEAATFVSSPVLAASKTPLLADGEVVPSFTASRVWPAAYALTSLFAKGDDLQRKYTSAALHLGNPGSKSLAPHPASSLPRVRGRTLLELGAGTGLVGIAAAAALGASKVWLTDLPENLPLLRTNARLNDVLKPNTAATRTNDLNSIDSMTQLDTHVVSVLPLNWAEPTLPREFASIERVDFIVAADCVYWPMLFGPLLKTCQRLLDAARDNSQPLPRVLLSMTHRLNRTQAFMQVLKARGWTATAFPGVSVLKSDVYELVRWG